MGDSICMKSPAENVLVENSIVTQGNGLVVGTSGDAWFRNITFRNCTARGTDFGCHIKFKDQQTGWVDGVVFEDIVIEDARKYAIGINQEGQSLGVSLRSNVSINNVIFRDIKASWTKGHHAVAGKFTCNPGALACRNITLEHVQIHSKTGCSFENTFGTG